MLTNIYREKYHSDYRQDAGIKIGCWNFQKNVLKQLRLYESVSSKCSAVAEKGKKS